VSLHPLAEHFASVAEDYERGRPEYPLAAVGALAAELRLPPGAPVLDLGAGTGKVTRALLAAGFDVVAVEPHQTLREVLAAGIGSERVLDGRAEEIPLADSSVIAVTAGDAFHWFDPETALPEIRRVLRPSGGLAVLSTVPDWSGASWAHELGDLVQNQRPEHPYFDGAPWQEAVRAAGGWSEPREMRLTTTRPGSPEAIIAHLASMSWMAAMPDEEREVALARIRDIITTGDTPDELHVHFLIGFSQLL
jgi:SAM-dependent methyltransferase